VGGGEGLLIIILILVVATVRRRLGATLVSLDPKQAGIEKLLLLCLAWLGVTKVATSSANGSGGCIISSMALMRDVASASIKSSSFVLVPTLAAFANTLLIIAVELDLESTDIKLSPVMDSRE
jgi:hypothetical protein